MLRGILEPFGKIDNIVLMKDSETGRSKGYGFITFSDSECARRALEQLNGFELAGRPMRIGHVTERPDGGTDITFPDGDQELDLGSAGGHLQLMAKLAEGSGIQLPTTTAAAAAVAQAAAAQAAALQLNGAVPLGALNPAALTALSPALNLASQAIASQCFQLSSLFTPKPCKLVARSTASLCLWVLPLPAPHLPFHGPFSPFCGPSHSEGMNTDGGELGPP